MIRGSGDYAEVCFTWCVLWYHCTVAFHLAGVQRPPHLASGHVTLDALRMTLFHASKIGSSQPLHISLPLHLHRTAGKSVNKTRSLSKACGVPSLQILYCMVPPSTQQTMHDHHHQIRCKGCGHYVKWRDKLIANESSFGHSSELLSLVDSSSHP